MTLQSLAKLLEHLVSPLPNSMLKLSRTNATLKTPLTLNWGAGGSMAKSTFVGDSRYLKSIKFSRSCPLCVVAEVQKECCTSSHWSSVR